MSQKIKNPNEKTSGFTLGVLALVAIVVVVIGAVVYMGRNQPIEGLPEEQPDVTVALDGDVIRLAAADAGDAPVATVYEDYSCHFCADMSTAGHADELAALEAGDLVVEYRTLNFLDRGAEGHSTRAYAVMRRLAETGDAALTWNFHTLLMRDQQTSATWDWADLADRAKSMGAAGDVVAEIRDGLDLDGAAASAKANAEKLVADLDLEGPSSPHVVVDGVDVTAGLGADTLGQWVAEAIKAGAGGGAAQGGE